MGLSPSKGKIQKILKNSVINPEYPKIEYKYKPIESKEVEENKINMGQGENSKNNEGDDFFFDDEPDFPDSIKTSLDIKEMNKFPYNTIGTISSQFPGEKEPLQNTCFLIYKNVVVTLASNIYNKNKGGRTESIMTTFSKNKVILDNKHIYIQGEEDKKIKGKVKEANDKDLEELNSKLAIILYDEIIGNEWIGVEGGKKEDFSGRDIYAVFSLGLKNQIAPTTINEDIIPESNNKTESKQHLREIFVFNYNPFLIVNKGGNEEEKAMIKCSPGSPLYYKDYNGGAYAIAIINENLEFQYFDKLTMKFLLDGVNKGKLLRNEKNYGIDEDNIISLDLSGNNFGPEDIKYLTDFDLINLRILDLSNNSIKTTGAFYLSKGKFDSLESLNLNNNKIGDEGLNHISNGFFYKLNSLELTHNNISSKGIKYLVKAKFINNLILLSLSDNPKIGDTGVKYMKENKGWNKLNILDLNYTGLTDVAVGYLGQSSMPKLEKLNIEGNKFGYFVKSSINALRLNKIHVSYLTEAERRREKENEKKNKKN